MLIDKNKYQHLGILFQLVEQFELISRTDLAKLSGLAPASITNLTKSLIDHQFIVEKTVQANNGRGRPAIGLSVSPLFWQQLCLTVSATKINISLCQLNGTSVFSEDYTVSFDDYPRLDEIILKNLQIFCQKQPLERKRLLAISICVLGKIDPTHTTITQLDGKALHCNIVEALGTQFNQPILLNEHFPIWLLAESTLGSLINDDNVIFVQLDDTIHLSVLMRGALLHQQSKMSVDKMLMPKFDLSDQIYPELDEVSKQQLANQIAFPALAKLIDQLLPNRFVCVSDKIDYLCQEIEQGNPAALRILNHISDNLAYMLMNLINIFSTEKILFNTPLLRIKSVLFKQILAKLKDTLLLEHLNVQIVTSQFEWQNPLIPSAAIKQGIYEGSLIKNIVQM